MLRGGVREAGSHGESSRLLPAAFRSGKVVREARGGRLFSAAERNPLNRCQAASLSSETFPNSRLAGDKELRCLDFRSVSVPGHL